jgi:hypothetical protein
MLVQVLNPEYSRPDVWQFKQEQFHYYEGAEVTVKHVGANQLALSTGIEEWPIRVIARSRIVSIDGVPYSYAPAEAARTVRGSRGETYTVTLGANPTCTCQGYQYRKTCKHVASK